MELNNSLSSLRFPAPLRLQFLLKLLILSRGGMYEGRRCCWIQHVDVVQVAYYPNNTVDELETGKTIAGVWHLTRGDDIWHSGEAEMLEGSLTPPI